MVVMCMFSRPVRQVANTRIFARGLDDGDQVLVYQMRFAADEALAMVLPLPVLPSASEDAVEFVNLERYTNFFDDIDRAFPEVQTMSRGGTFSMGLGAAQTLVVQDVGDYEASFVPRRADFCRLDPRFALPDEVMDELVRYADWGYAVFKLKTAAVRARPRWWRRWRSEPSGPPAESSGTRTVHPMAIRFPRRDPSRLFFPTVHVHDGSAPPRANFDHALYAQLRPAMARSCQWERSAGLARTTVAPARARGLVDGDAALFKFELQGQHENVDVELVTPRISNPSDLDLGGEGALYRCEIRARAAHRSDHATWDVEALRAVELARHHLDAFVTALDAELEALTTARRGDWALVELDDRFPLCQLDGSDGVLGTPSFMGGTAEPEAPMRMRFWTQVPGAEGQRFELAFGELPGPTVASDVREALRTALQRAVDRVAASTAAR